jgi:hypothetical protein
MRSARARLRRLARAGRLLPWGRQTNLGVTRGLYIAKSIVNVPPNACHCESSLLIAEPRSP